MALSRKVGFFDGLRYKGGGPMIAWILHRISGVGMVLFVSLHVAASFFTQQTGSDLGITINIIYQSIYFQLFVYFCVLFHGLNGIRIIILDLWPRMITYQRECYKILSDACQETQEEQTAVTPNIAALQQVKALGQALISLAEEQIEQEIRLSQTEQRLDQAVVVVGDLTKRVEVVEGQLGDPGRKVTPGQATNVSQAVKAVAMALSKASGRNEYGGVYGELYRRYEVPSYRELPAGKYDAVMAWLNEWLQSISSDHPF